MRARTRIATFVAIFGLTLGLTLSSASASQAQTRAPRTPGPAFDSAKQACETAIDNRLSRITSLQNLVNASQHVTSDHRSTLTSQLSSASNGMTALHSKIDGDTDPSTFRSDCRSIVTDYRIYVLVSPKVREVLVADLETDIASRLDAIAAKIQTAIDNAKAKGKDGTTAQSDLDQMKAQIANAKSAIGGVAASVIDLQPSDWPGAHDTMVNGRQSLRAGRNDLRSARDDGWNAVTALRQS
jgi:hypothetical protein